ncbi:glutathione transferase [Massilia glaciei]|uniref:Glutathione transferase n=1 Tax=Massilia glaciei TaxID=1524097 RepID=A0A2U2HA16_9BURK|nr:glutathione transferase [Massilia glaciei]PWF39561.1 glutathione transferase [Massilia glaciei]
MPDNALHLYVNTSFTSPYAMSCFVALVEKQLPFSLETIDLDAGQHLQPPYRDAVPSARIPALRHGDFLLSESSAIVEYLEDVFGAPEHAAALPAAPRERARARQVQAWLRSDLMALRNERSTQTIFYEPTTAPLSSEGRAAADKLIRFADSLVDGPNLFGQWCIADADLALMLQRLVANGDPVPPHLHDYAQRQWARDSVQQWVAKSRVLANQ